MGASKDRKKRRNSESVEARQHCHGKMREVKFSGDRIIWRRSSHSSVCSSLDSYNIRTREPANSGASSYKKDDKYDRKLDGKAAPDFLLKLRLAA